MTPQGILFSCKTNPTSINTQFIRRPALRTRVPTSQVIGQGSQQGGVRVDYGMQCKEKDREAPCGRSPPTHPRGAWLAEVNAEKDQFGGRKDKEGGRGGENCFVHTMCTFH